MLSLANKKESVTITDNSSRMSETMAETKIKLTAKQKVFIDEYLIDLNATQAAIRAGYSERTAESQGSRLLTNVKVAEHLQKMQGKRSERTDITQDYVLQSVFSAVERCKQAEPVIDRQGFPVLVENNDGDLVPAYTFNAMGVFKGAELLGKHLGMFVERAERKDTVVIRLASDVDEI